MKIIKSQSHRASSGLRGGAEGVLGARGVTQVRDGLHQDCCLMVQGLDRRSVSALSQSVRVGFNACVCVCERTLAKCLMTGKQSIAALPLPSRHSDQCLSSPALDFFFQLMYYCRGIAVRCLLTELLSPTQSFAELRWTALSTT